MALKCRVLDSLGETIYTAAHDGEFEPTYDRDGRLHIREVTRPDDRRGPRQLLRVHAVWEPGSYLRVRITGAYTNP